MSRIVLLAGLSLTSLFAFDAESEISKVREALSRASAAHDSDAFAKLVTPGFYATSRTGLLRDLAATIAHLQDTRPADLKVELLKSVTYGDTVVQGGHARNARLHALFTILRRNGVGATWTPASCAQSCTPIRPAASARFMARVP